MFQADSKTDHATIVQLKLFYGKLLNTITAADEYIKKHDKNLVESKWKELNMNMIYKQKYTEKDKEKDSNYFVREYTGQQGNILNVGDIQLGLLQPHYEAKYHSYLQSMILNGKQSIVTSEFLQVLSMHHYQCIRVFYCY
ncbi:MAG: hypothetical protein EZS28_011825 [Streblomastix strix]|uniref:Uncharacterized protein n=1 Tax=Streblomastix strix TaxID=222440 RepID=A0A5J4WD75_9EUKA|nr:MAG: hypothetical protein EZS28_011825 [Streblomastix strix]